MHIEEEIISNSIIEIRHQSKLLKATGQDLFEEKNMTRMCAFNLLGTIPSSLAFVKNNLYQELKLSKKVPKIKSVLSEVELSLARGQEVPVLDALALHIGKRAR
ncbi:hypothetical protein O181_094629 [Austropuccinia psidii MF-1]|uniref:Uncharacterized protein n=1 Tax=Austropuccinia psidii MF-1 TaxID=1389203 RepID=A0A9Q3PAZ9_9BASI|nr:hypothetical protein [Austropuccinia psidii MF-1]